MTNETIGIGIVGAGANTRLRHVPGFKSLAGVELVGVVNRTPESSSRAAEEHGIPRTYADWQSLVSDPNVDAVMIGTWPNMHCEITCAALEAGKHVLTEARMARNAVEAHRMLDASRAHPNLVTQIVPSPIGFTQHNMLRQLIDEGFLGELRELVVVGANDLFWHADQPVHWRQEREISGNNVLAMGILHEAALRYAPPPTRVFAQTTVFEPQRPAADQRESVDITVPDSVQIVSHVQGGARGLYHLSGIDLFGPGSQIHLYGSRGTIKLLVGPEEKLLVGRAGEAQLQEVEIPSERRGGWRVEAEFIGAIRGEETVKLTDFETGVQYMEFTDAVARSAATNQPVELPLQIEA